MTIIDDLEPLAVKWREQRIPILGLASAKWLLSLIEKEKPKRILEIGTAVGYSGTILASSGASLVTMDTDEKALTVAEETFAKFNVDAQIICEDAKEALKDISQLSLMPGEFDLIFIDHWKAKYLEVLEYCIKLSRKGTIIIADNIKNPKCLPFVAAITKDERLETTLYDVGDGLSMSIVK